MRDRAGLSQEQFGEIVSLGTKNVSDVERGVVGITLSTLKRICEKFSLSSDWILFGAQEKNDIQDIAERLERLPKKELEAILSFLNRIFELFALLEK